MTKQKVSLSDRYTQHAGPIHLRGSQAMVRLLLLQRQRDVAAGLNTGGFVSGYRGSPMTAIDEELWRAGQLLPDHHVTFWPGTNEHLAMTSIWDATNQLPQRQSLRWCLWYVVWQRPRA